MVRLFRRQVFPEEFPKEYFRHPLPFSSLSALRFRRDLPYGNPSEELYY